jgi:flagellar hook protein FlgE
MISGDGFFVVNSVNEQLYTRAGAFNFDAEGKLVTPTGAAVQGWPAPNGVVDTNLPLGDIRLPMGTLIAPTATDTVVIAGNLPADAADPSTITRSIKTYDVTGNTVTLTSKFDFAGGVWSVTFDDGVNPPVGPTALTFGANGRVTAPTFTDRHSVTKVGLLFDPLTTGGIDIDLAGLTEYTGNPTVQPLSQNGAPAATLQSFSINPDGQLVGVFSNGNKQTVAQVALANFNNPPGLEKAGDSLYRFTVNSGLAQVATPGTAGLGTLQSGAVEMSNVDLAQEFTSLIVAQRGFQANSKVISTSDDVLQELVNLKR